MKKGDFIEIDYVGKTDGTVFDTTIKAEAEKAGLNPKNEYKPAIICLGEKQLLPGLDEFLIGKELGSYTVELPAGKAFGKKDTKLLKLIPRQKFKEAKIEPFSGLEVNIDNHYGIVRSVSGGRVTVDFNHPLAGKDLTYEVTVKRVVQDTQEQVNSILTLMGLPFQKTEMEKDTAVIHMEQPLPQPVAEQLTSHITKLTGAKVTFHISKQ